MTNEPAVDRRVFNLLPLSLAAVLLIGGFRLATESSSCSANKRSITILRHLFPILGNTNGIQDVDYDEEEAEEQVLLPNVTKQDCNLLEGKWVLDKEGCRRPLYTEDSCPYLSRQVTCLKNGRPDSLYLQWKWKPYGCDLPSFDAVKLLDRLRNKRLMFVGDSIQRSQWESMVCLLQSATPEEMRSMYKDPPRRIFVAKEFNATVEFYWAPFLVESNSDHATKHQVQRRRVKLDSIARHSRNWQGAHVLVFESYIWWMYKPVINATRTGSSGVKEYSVTKAYRLALQTWAKWMESGFNPRTQKAFFISLSPTHLWSREWQAASKGNCFNETEPINGTLKGSGSTFGIMRAIAETLQGLKVNVTLVNITQLTEYRKDGHTSVYTERRGELLTEEQRSQPDVYADCIHWCLPGIPDTWNKILYAHLIQDGDRSKPTSFS